MGKIGQSIGGLLGVRSSTGAGDPKKQFFDIGKEIAPSQQISRQLLQDTMRARAEGLPAQEQALAQMGEAALGRGPSLAEAQMKSAQDRSLAQQLAAARSGRAGSASMARGLLRAQGEAGRNLAQDAAISRLQERQSFMDAMARQEAQARQDLSGMTELAAMPKREMQQAELARAQAAAQREARRSQMLGGAISGAASFLAASDEKMKKDIKPKDSNKFKDFLSKLEAYSYEYKDPKAPGASHGRKYGIMAQDLEKSEVGRSMVKNTKHGKMVDIASGFGAVLASQAELNKRLSQLEKKKGKV